MRMATDNQKLKFFQDVVPYIMIEATQRGYKICSTVIAQAIIESNWGLSQLSLKYNNFFGMKCGSSWKGKSVNMKTKEEYTKGTLTTISDNFRVYDSIEEGVKGYYDFISTKRYANLKTATTPEQYAQFLKADGYATSSTYVNTLVNTINTYKLEQYDVMNDVQPVVQPVTKTVDPLNPYGYIPGQVYTTTVNLNVRDYPGTGKILKTYKAGTRVTCKGLIWVGENIWMQTPSGWCCTEKNGKRYIK